MDVGLAGANVAKIIWQSAVILIERSPWRGEALNARRVCATSPLRRSWRRMPGGPVPLHSLGDVAITPAPATKISGLPTALMRHKRRIAISAGVTFPNLVNDEGSSGGFPDAAEAASRLADAVAEQATRPELAPTEAMECSRWRVRPSRVLFPELVLLNGRWLLGRCRGIPPAMPVG